MYSTYRSAQQDDGPTTKANSLWVDRSSIAITHLYNVKVYRRIIEMTRNSIMR